MPQLIQKKGAIGFEGLKISCIIGTHTHERTEAQPILVDLRVGTDFRPSAQTDSLSATVDYNKLSQIIVEEASKGQYRLLETLASHALDRILLNTLIQWAWIRLRKPQAIQDASYAIVELERHRE